MARRHSFTNLVYPRLDDLLIELARTNVGCYWDDVFVGALVYADDVTLLARTPSALRKLLAV